jgi:type I site-specific restriction-modification system R (restriction) subunit
MEVWDTATGLVSTIWFEYLKKDVLLATAAGAAGGFLSKLLSDHLLENKKGKLARSLEEKKSELAQELEGKKGEISRQLEDKRGEFARELERLKGELTRETETYRLKLKKQELFFTKEVEAVSAFVELYHTVKPPILMSHMEFEDAREEVAGKMFAVENELRQFRVRHGMALSAGVRDDLDFLIAKVGHAKFDERDGGSHHSRDVAAGEVLDTLQSIEQRLFAEIRG